MSSRGSLIRQLLKSLVAHQWAKKNHANLSAKIRDKNRKINPPMLWSILLTGKKQAFKKIWTDSKTSVHVGQNNLLYKYAHLQKTTDRHPPSCAGSAKLNHLFQSRLKVCTFLIFITWKNKLHQTHVCFNYRSSFSILLRNSNFSQNVSLSFSGKNRSAQKKTLPKKRLGPSNHCTDTVRFYRHLCWQLSNKWHGRHYKSKLSV